VSTAFCSSTSKIIPLEGEDEKVIKDLVENRHFLDETAAVITVKKLHELLLLKDFSGALNLIGTKTRMKMLKAAQEKSISEQEVLKKSVVRFRTEEGKDPFRFLMKNEQLTFSEQSDKNFSAKKVTIIAKNNKGETESYYLRMSENCWKVEMEDL
jgi:hypothetical protein